MGTGEGRHGLPLMVMGLFSFTMVILAVIGVYLGYSPRADA